MIDLTFSQEAVRLFVRAFLVIERVEDSKKVTVDPTHCVSKTLVKPNWLYHSTSV
jgi:hypothetical protein